MQTVKHPANTRNFMRSNQLPQQNDIIHNSRIIDNIYYGLHKNDILTINILFPYFFYFATSEVLRRILIIFDQNLNGIKTWNKVLEIQIDHLIEANFLFK